MPSNKFKFDHKRLSEARGDLLQIEAAEMLGISKQLLNAYEKGIAKPTIEGLAEILEVYNLTFNDLVRPLSSKSSRRATLKARRKVELATASERQT